MSIHEKYISHTVTLKHTLFILEILHTTEYFIVNTNSVSSFYFLMV